MVFFVVVCFFWTIFVWVCFLVITCVSVTDGSTNGSDAKFDAMNCLFLLSFDVFWAVSVSIMVVFFVSLVISLSDSVWSPFSTCVLYLSICVLFFYVSLMVVYFLFSFISVSVVMSLLILVFSGVFFFLKSWYLLLVFLCVAGFALFQLEIHLMLWSLVNTLSTWRSSLLFFFDDFINLYIFFFC